jgi:hypothetical protein
MNRHVKPTLDLRPIFGAALDRLLTGDLAGYRGPDGTGDRFVDKLAHGMLLDPVAAAKATTAADARARGLPQLKAAVERATTLNRPKQALLDRLAQCRTLFQDETFFRHFPRRLHPLFPWQPSREPRHPLEGVYLPLNRWGSPLGEGPEWDGDFGDYVTQAWHFRWDDDTPDEALYTLGCGGGLSLMDHYTDDYAPAFLATYGKRLRRVIAEAKPGLGGLADNWD